MSKKKKGRACEICGQVGYTVRDHDHATGYIRGRLCNPCNGRLGAYESELRRGPYCTGRDYLAWLARHGDAIEAHLKKNTGVKYVARKPKKKDRREIRSKLDPPFKRNPPMKIPAHPIDRLRAEAQAYLDDLAARLKR